MGGIAAEDIEIVFSLISTIFKLILKVPKSMFLTTSFNFFKIKSVLDSVIVYKLAFVTETIIPEATPCPVASPHIDNRAFLEVVIKS